jgi:hypothetical protein
MSVFFLRNNAEPPFAVYFACPNVEVAACHYLRQNANHLQDELARCQCECSVSESAGRKVFPKYGKCIGRTGSWWVICASLAYTQNWAARWSRLQVRTLLNICEGLKYMGDYIEINRLHTLLSMEILEMEGKTQICIYNILHTDAWKHRLNHDRA